MQGVRVDRDGGEAGEGRQRAGLTQHRREGSEVIASTGGVQQHVGRPPSPPQGARTAQILLDANEADIHKRGHLASSGFGSMYWMPSAASGRGTIGYSRRVVLGSWPSFFSEPPL